MFDERLTQRRELVTRVKELLVRALQLDLTPDEIAEDSPLFGFGLGLDSIDALTIIVGIEDELGVVIPEDMPYIFRSVNTIADFVASGGARDGTV